MFFHRWRIWNILTHPLHRTKIPRGDWPSTNNTAPLGYAVAYLRPSKDRRAAVFRSQKSRSALSLQVKQLSTMSKPYGESAGLPPVKPHGPAKRRMYLVFRQFVPLTRACDVQHATLVSAVVEPLAVTPAQVIVTRLTTGNVSVMLVLQRLSRHTGRG